MGARTDSTEATASTISAGLILHVVFALLVGIAIGLVAATTSGASAVDAVGILLGVAVGLVGVVAVPALLRL